METTARRQLPRAATGSEQRLDVNVIYTDRRATLRALREAARLAASLDARIRILMPSVVPYPLPLQEPPVCEAHLRRRLRAVAGAAPVETSAEIICCRDYADVARALDAGSLVVIGGKARWWRPWSAFRTLERAMARRGHHLIVVKETHA